MEYRSQLFDLDRESPDVWLNERAREGWRLFGQSAGPHGWVLVVMERPCAVQATA